jgi:hypothetical protein
MMMAYHLKTIGGSVLFLVAAGLWLAPGIMAHHGWGWATDEEFEITGRITGVRLGNPHGEVTIDVAGTPWTVEVGQPWRNERAGLTGSLLRIGTFMTVHGHRSAHPGKNLVKAERVLIGGRDFNLYPDRKS